MTRSEAIETLKQLLADSQDADQDGVEEIPFDYKDRLALKILLQEIDHASYRIGSIEGRNLNREDNAETREEDGSPDRDLQGRG